MATNRDFLEVYSKNEFFLDKIIPEINTILNDLNLNNEFVRQKSIAIFSYDKISKNLFYEFLIVLNFFSNESNIFFLKNYKYS